MNAQVSGFAIYKHWHQHNSEGTPLRDHSRPVSLVLTGDHKLSHIVNTGISPLTGFEI